MLSLLCFSLIMTLGLLFITFYQCFQIYSMKSELRKCLRVLKRGEQTETRIGQTKQIAKSLESFKWY